MAHGRIGQQAHTGSIRLRYQPRCALANIESFKKQAKQYVRWHREGYRLVAAKIRVSLPRYRYFTDQRAMASGFQLSDAQELIVRIWRFRS